MLKRRSATPVAAQPTTPTFDPSTWANQPRLLAGNQAEAAAVNCAAWAVGILLLFVVGGVVAWQEFGADPADVAAVVAVAIVVGVIVTLWRWSTVYSSALQADTEEARRATWRQEVLRGEDLDGDNVIGDPFRGITVPRKGGGTEQVTFSHPPSSRRGEPILDGWGICASDLVAMLYEAEMSRGLGERAWVGDGVTKFTLPSGKQVTQSLFRGVQAALAEHDMASKPAGKWQLDVTADDVAAQLANLKR